MQNLFRRPSGTYVLRLTVPVHLRAVIGKREIIVTTGTSELSIAKMVAGALATQWRQQFFESERLLSQSPTSPMPYQEILKIAQGHPTLLAGGHLKLSIAASASGISVQDLLRASANGNLGLHVRTGGVSGYLLPMSSLELDDPALGRNGGFIVPADVKGHAHAVDHMSTAMLTVLAVDLPGITAEFISNKQTVTPLSFAQPDHPEMVFIPTREISVPLDSLEVSAGEVEMLRRSLAKLIEPERIREAKDLQKLALHNSTLTTGRKDHQLLSQALEKYITNRVRHDVVQQGEITRIKNGCALLIELGGDVPLAEIDADRLRHFRDTQLSRVPANENKIRLKHGTTCIVESMEKVAGTEWPVMSVSERNKRMRWISGWFAWLKVQGSIAGNPAAALHGESVQSKADRKNAKPLRRDDEARDAFKQEDLNMIFAATWFKTGSGALTKLKTYRTFIPFYYWLPLLGLYTGGGRINELSQLHLADIQQTTTGQWFVNFNDDEIGQKLKNKPSKRKVPLHPALLALGFDKWVAALAAKGYTRLFPELKHDSEKGYGKAATKWFTTYMASLGIPRNGTKTFHSFRHTYTNALPTDTPARLSRQLTGHARGTDIHDKTYMKDMEPDAAAIFVNRLNVTLPVVSPFNIAQGMEAINHALQRKDRGRGAGEDIGGR